MAFGVIPGPCSEAEWNPESSIKVRRRRQDQNAEDTLCWIPDRVIRLTPDTVGNDNTVCA